jgi:hypothetical protein
MIMAFLDILKFKKISPNPSNPCNSKVVEIDGKKYKLQEIS